MTPAESAIAPKTVQPLTAHTGAPFGARSQEMTQHGGRWLPHGAS